MSIIFISGSRKISKLSAKVVDRLKNLIQQQHSIIIGDANGVDKQVQKFFFDEGYNNVRVFCSGGSSRNNIGKWPEEHILVDKSLKGRDFYTAKDKVMAGYSDFGFVIWDGESIGSLNNIKELIVNNKKALVYFNLNQCFYKISSVNDIDKLKNQVTTKKCCHIYLDGDSSLQNQFQFQFDRTDAVGHSLLS